MSATSRLVIRSTPSLLSAGSASSRIAALSRPLTKPPCHSFSGFTYPAPRVLDALVKLDLLQKETPEKVKEIWNTYHSEKEFNIAETWTSNDFEAFQEARKKAGGLFIFPVPREEGHFVVLSQVQEKHVLFTYLEDYKKDPHSAQPYLVLTFYDELVGSSSGDSPGPVLVRGDIIPGALDRKESWKLLELLKRFYLENTDDLASFNKGEFDFEKHITRLLEE